MVAKTKQTSMGNSRINNARGLVLVGLVVVIVLAAIAFSVAMYLLANAIDEARIQETRERLRAIEAASVGHQFLFHNDSGSNVGHFSHATSFPTTAAQLLDLQSHMTGSPATEDSYGNVIAVATDGTDFTITSTGPTAETISLLEAPRTSADVAIQICDASPTGVAYLSKSYIKDYSNDSVVQDDENDGRMIFDNGDLTVRLTLSETGAGALADRFNTGVGDNNTFEWDNVTFGWHMLTIQPVTDNTHYDPYWTDSDSDDTTNRLVWPLFIYPTTTRQRFNIIYPVIAKAYGLDEQGVKDVNNNHEDETICNDGWGWDGLSEGDNGVAWPNNTWEREFHAVGNGDPDGMFVRQPLDANWQTVGNRVMRTWIKFRIDNTTYPDIVIGAGGSKVSYAALRLFRHAGGAGVNPWGYDGDPSGSGTVEVWRYQRNYAEDNSSTYPHAITWADFRDQGTDYDNLQDSWTFNANGFHDFIVTQAAQNWVDGTWTNQGFLIKLQNEGSVGDYWSFQTSESNNDGTRPLLIIAYYP